MKNEELRMQNCGVRLCRTRLKWCACGARDDSSKKMFPRENIFFDPSSPNRVVFWGKRLTFLG